MDYSNYKLNKKEKIKYYLMASGFLSFTGLLFYKSIIFAIVLTSLAIPGKKIYEKYLAKKRQMELRLQFKDLLYSFSSSFQSGRQMSEALQEGEENLRLIYEIHAPIMHELRIINRSLSVERLSEEEVLNDFANRSSCEDIKNFVDVYFICRATGGDMHKVIMHAIEIIIDKLNIEKDINTIMDMPFRFYT